MTETTGTGIIRGALLNRAKHGHLGLTARDLGVGIGALEEFCYGRGQLPPATLQALAKDLFPHAEWDEATNLMRPVNRIEPKPLGVPPPPFKRKPLTFKTGAPPAQTGYGPAREPEKRAGWLGGFTKQNCAA
jgi:hypothetical protein